MKRILAALLAFTTTAQASDHLDSPTAIANPQADIGDLFAWMSPDAKRLNLVLDIVGKSFSDRLRYVLHVEGDREVTISCRFHAADDIECGGLRGDASHPDGLWSADKKMRVFAGLRDDPFFNNVKGTRAAYQVAIAALHGQTGCPLFDKATVAAIRDQWTHTDGGPAKNYLAGWTTSALVVSLDVEGAKRLAVWGATTTADGTSLNRMGRPLTKNALLGLMQPAETANALKERWNALTPAQSGEFIPEIARALALYDGFDGQCGNQFLADYHKLATLLADDRLLVNATTGLCREPFAVERGIPGDCGGRTPLYDAANAWRALVINGTVSGADDGLDHDEITPSATEFPFLAPPQS